MRASVTRLILVFVTISMPCLTLLTVAPRLALAAYPDRPIRLIVPLDALHGQILIFALKFVVSLPSAFFLRVSKLYDPQK